MFENSGHGLAIDHDAGFDDGGPTILLAEFFHAGAGGASVETTDPVSDRSVLMLAAMGGAVETAKVLLNAGADLTRTDSVGRTATDLARSQQRIEIVTLLEAH